MNRDINRRTFIRNTAAAGLGLGVAAHLSPLYAQVAPNDRVVVGVMGVYGRGNALAEAFARVGGAEVAYVCDVDERAVERTVGAVSERQDDRDPLQERRPEGVKDFRRILEDDDVDALVIAAPDHWHAPATLLALDAGKHVYVEKPCSHNPHEGELLLEAQQKHADRIVQMGNQQRSSPRSIAAMEAIGDGIIGRPYFARAWYANRRGPTHLENPAEVPSWLDYELWQGPAPRRDYQDGLIHYDWHWFWHWGTAEICNNGTHEIDVCRWALDVDHPMRVTSTGGRYHFDDDWEAFDTQVAGFEFEDDKSIIWEGRSCNANPIKGGEGLPGGGRGASIHGTDGTIVIDRGGYVVYDNDNNLIHYENEAESGQQTSGLDTVGAGNLTDRHVANFAAAVRGDEDPRAPIDDARKSVLLCHLGNIAQRVGHDLTVEPATGRITDDDEAMQLWSRDYEPGWEPTV